MSTADQLQTIATIQSIQNTYLYYASLILCPIGMLFNICSILVFLRKKLRKSLVAVFSIVLAVVDIAILVVFCFEFYLTSIKQDPQYKSDAYCRWYNYLIRVFIHISSWTQVAMTVDRTIEVSFSRRFHISKNKLIAGIIFLATLIVILAVNFGSLTLRLVITQKNSTNGNETAVTTSAQCTAGIGFLISRDIMSLCVRTLIPFAIMLVSNFVLIRSIIRSKENLKRHNSNDAGHISRKAMHLAYSIIALDVVFFITNFPVAIGLTLVDVYVYFAVGTALDLAIVFFFQYLSIYLGAMNFILPFLINLKFNKIFRREFLDMILEHTRGFVPESLTFSNSSKNNGSHAKNQSSVMITGKITSKSNQREILH